MVAAKIGFGLLLLTYAAVEIGFSFDTWLSTGSDVDEYLQDRGSIFQDVLSDIIEFITYPVNLIIIFAVMLQISKKKSLEILFVYVIGEILLQVLKMSIAFPRPCWYSRDVSCRSCSKLFGDPSGHSMISVLVIPFAIFRCKGTSFLLIPVILFEAIVIYFRMYSGSHTYSQIGFGVVLALYTGYLIQENHKKLKNFIRLIREEHNTKNYIYLAVICLFPAVLSSILYGYRKVYWENNWTFNIDRYCDKFDGKDSNQAQFLAAFQPVMYLAAFPGYWAFKYLRYKEGSMKFWQKALRVLIVVAVFHGINLFCSTLLFTGNVPLDALLRVIFALLQGLLCCGVVAAAWNWAFVRIKKEVKKIEKEQKEKEKKRKRKHKTKEKNKKLLKEMNKKGENADGKSSKGKVKKSKKEKEKSDHKQKGKGEKKKKDEGEIDVEDTIDKKESDSDESGDLLIVKE